MFTCDRTKKLSYMEKIFSYGSLVSIETWSFKSQYEVATAYGWVRQWKKIINTEKGKICALTVSPKKKSSLDGILISADQFVQKKIDKREEGYEKIRIENDMFLYISEQSTCCWASEDAPIIKSYIDVVAHGYFQILGEEGFIKFFETTEGWELPIMDDRSNPLYPRALNLNDNFLKKIDCQIEKERDKSYG